MQFSAPLMVFPKTTSLGDSPVSELTAGARDKHLLFPRCEKSRRVLLMQRSSEEMSTCTVIGSQREESENTQ